MVFYLALQTHWSTGISKRASCYLLLGERMCVFRTIRGTPQPPGNSVFILHHYSSLFLFILFTSLSFFCYFRPLPPSSHLSFFSSDSLLLPLLSLLLSVLLCLSKINFILVYYSFLIFSLSFHSFNLILFNCSCFLHAE